MRKVFGYTHIPQHYAERLNQFNKQALNPYLNYHRPCLFPTTIVTPKGKQKKKYEYKNMMTPYEKFKSLPDAQQYLKMGLDFKKLDDIAKTITDNEAADYLQKQRKLLFKDIHEDYKKRA